MNRRNEEFATLWDFISSDKSLSDSEKILYSIILSLSTQKGHCWATNSQLMERMGYDLEYERNFKKHIADLKIKGWIKTEGSTRNRTIIPLKKRISVQNDTNPDLKKLIGVQNDTNISVKKDTNPPLPLYSDHNKLDNKENKEKHIEAWGKPMLLSKTTQKNTKNEGEMEKKEKPKKSPFSQAVLTPYGYYQLPPMMIGTPPTPGCAKMVAEVRDLLSNQIHIGSRSYKMAEEDKAWFFGYSPVVIEAAIARTHHTSKTGNPIRNLVAAIFASCGDIRREGEKDSGPEFSMHYR